MIDGLMHGAWHGGLSHTSANPQMAVKIEKKRDMRSVKQESKILKKLHDSQCTLIVEASASSHACP